jgi:hypothetical protein
MNDLRHHPFVAPLAALAASLALAAPVQAADSFFDFEGGDVGSWLESTTGGSGSTGVETHNGSQMAFAKHVGSYKHSLSHDFGYVPGDVLSFDMQAVANPGVNTHSFSGVSLSFLNSFNVSLGSMALYNTTDPASLTAHQYAIDNLQHGYSATMSSWAMAAGVLAGAPVAKVAVSFIASAQTYFNYGYFYSDAYVWFDNVRVAAVPEPGQWALMLAGLLATAHTARRRRRG